MRITIVYKYFWPDQAPYSLLLSKMVPWIVEAGHEVSIISAQPAYAAQAKKSPSRETVFGAEVKRMSLLPNFFPKANTINLVLFSILAALRVLLGQRQDVIWFGTTPPVIQAFLVGIAARIRGSKTLYQMQDIHPEIAIHSNIMKESFLTRILRRLDRYTLRKADYVTVLSQDMADCIEEISGKNSHLKIINNFPLTDDGLRSEKIKSGPIRFCYAGNIGQFQNLEKLMKVFGKLDAEVATLEMVGDGKLRGKLEKLCRHEGYSNITFHGQKTMQEAFVFLQTCDVGLVTLLPGIYRYAYPTKIHTYFAAHLRVLALIEKDSQLARSLHENGLGVSIEWSSSDEEIGSAIGALISICQKNRDGFTPPKEFIDEDIAKSKWIALLNEIASIQVQGHSA